MAEKDWTTRPPGPMDRIVTADGKPTPIMAAWMRDTARIQAGLIRRLIDDAVLPSDWRPE